MVHSFCWLLGAVVRGILMRVRLDVMLCFSFTFWVSFPVQHFWIEQISKKPLTPKDISPFRRYGGLGGCVRRDTLVPARVCRPYLPATDFCKRCGDTGTSLREVHDLHCHLLQCTCSEEIPPVEMAMSHSDASLKACEAPQWSESCCRALRKSRCAYYYNSLGSE